MDMAASIVLKPGWLDGSIRDPADSADPELELGQVEEKIEEEKTWCDLVDPVKNPVAIY